MKESKQTRWILQIAKVNESWFSESSMSSIGKVWNVHDWENWLLIMGMVNSQDDQIQEKSIHISGLCRSSCSSRLDLAESYLLCRMYGYALTISIIIKCAPPGPAVTTKGVVAVSLPMTRAPSRMSSCTSFNFKLPGGAEGWDAWIGFRLSLEMSIAIKACKEHASQKSSY